MTEQVYITQQCLVCGKTRYVEFGAFTLYEDSTGQFYYTGKKCHCGHKLNYERLPNALPVNIKINPTIFGRR